MELILIFTFAALIFGHFYLRHKESKSLFKPSDKVWPSPKEVSLDYEDVNIASPDGVKLHGWYLENEASDRVVLFCHGNARSIHELIDRIAFFHSLGLSVMIFDYRGYGMSKGKPSEYGVCADARAFYDYLIKARSYDADEIILYGLSLGGAVAVDLAYHHKVAAVIVEGTFSSVRDMGKFLYPWVPSALVRQSFNSLHKVKSFTAPFLCLHSKNDKSVPYKLGAKLFEAVASEYKRFVMLEGEHPSACIDEASRCSKEIKQFVERLS